MRYDINIVNGITSVIKENNITDLILGLHQKTGISDSFLGNLTEGILKTSTTTTFIYKSFQPISTIKRHLIFVPQNAEKEIGFVLWMNKLWNLAKNTGSKLVFYASENTINFIKEIHESNTTLKNIDSKFIEFNDWENLSEFKKNIHKNDNLIFILSRKNKLSYQLEMDKIPSYLNKELKHYSFILIYPIQGESLEITLHENKRGGVLQTFIEPSQTLHTLQTLNKLGRKSTKWLRKK